MNAEQARLLFRFQKVGGTDIGRQHALFNKAMRVIANDRYDGFDLALIVKLHLRFDRVEIDGAAFLARGMQRLEQGVQSLQLRLHGLMHRCRWREFARQPTPDLVISQTGTRAKHRRIEPILGHITVGIHFGIADHGQTIDIRVQRTQTIGEFLRQHRDNPAREIHRVTTCLGLNVQR